MTDVHAVTFNLGCGGPHGAARIRAAHRWAAKVRSSGYQLVFVQESPGDDWIDAWSATHHRLWTATPRYNCRSVLLVSKDLACTAVTLPTAAYQGSYVAVASVTLPDQCDLLCFSIHASPTPLTAEWIARWDACNIALAGRRDGPLWDADFALSSARSMVADASGRPILAAGDWNEARAWDTRHPRSTAGADFFNIVRECGLTDCTYRDWRCEIPTCTSGMQVDHVFATTEIASRVSVPLLSERQMDPDFDHIPISFTIGDAR
jgi:hypothetical protein